MQERLERQLAFIIEIDKVKSVFRQTRLFDNSRHENDAEHAWHLAMMAAVLAEYSNEPVNTAKVMKMVLIHDLVEIDAGDVFLYDAAATTTKKQKETEAADRIFGLLPEDLATEFRGLWDEFERRDSPESRFAAALDRMEPVLQNSLTGGHAWKKHGICKEQVLAANKHIAEGSTVLWNLVRNHIDQAAESGILAQ